MAGLGGGSRKNTTTSKVLDLKQVPPKRKSKLLEVPKPGDEVGETQPLLSFLSGASPRNSTTTKNGAEDVSERERVNRRLQKGRLYFGDDDDEGAGGRSAANLGASTYFGNMLEKFADDSLVVMLRRYREQFGKSFEDFFESGA